MRAMIPDGMVLASTVMAFTPDNRPALGAPQAANEDRGDTAGVPAHERFTSWRSDIGMS